jgi:leader peptidase (prepilin peptidase)/N-methyltransferase
MLPILIVTVALLAGALVGLVPRRNLSTLRYRHADELHLPEPGPRCWVVWASALALGGLTIAAAVSNTPWSYLSVVPLAIVGPWLGAVDFDVLRIPNRVLAPTAVATLLVLIGMAAGSRNWGMIVVPVAGSLVVGGIFVVVHFLTHDGIGFGDAKLAALIGLSVGPLGAGAVWLGILVGSAAALLWAQATRMVGCIPYGPWLLCGAWIASLVSVAAARAV